MKNRYSRPAIVSTVNVVHQHTVKAWQCDTVGNPFKMLGHPAKYSGPCLCILSRQKMVSFTSVLQSMTWCCLSGVGKVVLSVPQCCLVWLLQLRLL